MGRLHSPLLARHRASFHPTRLLLFAALLKNYGRGQQNSNCPKCGKRQPGDHQDWHTRLPQPFFPLLSLHTVTIITVNSDVVPFAMFVVPFRRPAES